MVRKLPWLVAMLMSVNAMAASQAIVAVTPTVNAGVAYHTGDQIGSVMTITPQIDQLGQIMDLAQISVVDKSPAGGPMDIYLFNGPGPISTSSSNGQTANIADSVVGSSCIGVFNITNANYSGFSGSSTATAQATNFVFNLDNSTKSIYAVAVARGTFTYAAASDLVLKFGMQPLLTQ